MDKSGGDSGNSKFFEGSAENLVTALAMWERHSRGDQAELRNIRAPAATVCVPSNT